MSLKDNLVLKPLSKDFTIIIEQAEIVSDRDLSELRPLYWVDISQESEEWRSLILDQRGRYFKSIRSTTWLVNRFCQECGFTYDSWQKYLRMVENTQRTIYPYVCGEVVIFRIMNRQSNHPDWINLTHCHDLKLVNQDQQLLMKDPHCSKTQLYFHYQLLNPGQSHLTIQLDNYRTTLTLQMVKASEYWNSWHYYLQGRLSQLHLNYSVMQSSVTYQHLMQAIPGFNSTRTYDKDPFLIRNFKRFYPVNEYLNWHSSSWAKRVSSLLKGEKLDQKYVQEALEDYEITQQFYNEF